MSGLVAGLPMYEFPWTAPALDAVWGWIGAFLRDRGVAAPASLTRDLPLQTLWRHPGLVLGQTCGYPYRHGLADAVEGREIVIRFYPRSNSAQRFFHTQAELDAAAKHLGLSRDFANER